MNLRPEEISSVIKEQIKRYSAELEVSEVGTVVEDITGFEKEFFDYLDTKHPEIPAAIAEEKVISDATEEKLVKALNDFKAEFLK